MDRVRDHLLAGARLPADQHGRGRGGDLGDLLVHVLHRPAVPDDVAEVVALAQLLPELPVLLEQALPLGLDEAVDAHGLAHHRGHDPEELGLAVVALVGLVGQGHAQRSHRARVGGDRHADEGRLVAARLLEDPGAVQEERLAAHLRHHHRLAALHHAAGDALADLVARAPRGL